MNRVQHDIQHPVDRLTRAYIQNYSVDAARYIEKLPSQAAAEALEEQPDHVLIPLLDKLNPWAVDKVLSLFPDEKTGHLFSIMDTGLVTRILGRLDAATRERYLSLVPENINEELRELLEFPEDSAARLMNTRIITVNENITVEQAIKQIKNQDIKKLPHLLLVDNEMRFTGQINTHSLALVDGDQILSSISEPVKACVSALDPKDEAMDMMKRHHLESLPVVDFDFKLLGTIEAQNMIDAIREDLATNMQTMVGVSKDERALSNSWFAVKKRLPWLQINLLTAFLAAAVVGFFESTIAKYTALAVLLPIAAGQSGNTGAQALAVTMRGLTVREITVRHWLRVTLKETAAGIINGMATAVTCGVGVFLWSKSYGLSLIIGLSMISSMTIAAVAGALVPIILKKMGQDPALSSSIILTTVTDIAGFLSFLGIATMLSGMLVAS